jgi:osmotically-inducible protein OsmY
MWLNQPTSEFKLTHQVYDNYNLLISVDKSKGPESDDTILNDDLATENKIYSALRNNSKTGHLTNIKVYAKRGVVTLLGLASNEDEIVHVYDLVKELDGINAFKMNFRLKK